jgi:hypothetical protein
MFGLAIVPGNEYPSIVGGREHGVSAGKKGWTTPAVLGMTIFTDLRSRPVSWRSVPADTVRRKFPDTLVITNRSAYFPYTR